MTTDNLTPFQRFQLERYGNFLVAGRLVTAEEFENGSADQEAEEDRLNAHFELELLSHE